MLVLLLWVVTSLEPGWQHELAAALQQLVGPLAADAVTLVLENAARAPAWAAGPGVTLVGASAVFVQLQGAINHVWNLVPRPGGAIIAWGCAHAWRRWVGCCRLPF